MKSGFAQLKIEPFFSYASLQIYKYIVHTHVPFSLDE